MPQNGEETAEDEEEEEEEAQEDGEEEKEEGEERQNIKEEGPSTSKDTVCMGWLFIDKLQTGIHSLTCVGSGFLLTHERRQRQDASMAPKQEPKMLVCY